MTSLSPPSAVHGALMLADIGGYTAFLGAVATAHQDDAFAGGTVPPAYAMISHLLDGIVERLVPPFTLSKLEGDAVFVYREEGPEMPRGDAVLDRIEACYADFRRRLDEAHGIWSCRCDACARIDSLDLKFVVHAGAFVTHAVAGSLELVGSEVVMVHRLLKTSAAAVVGHGAYALLTEAAVSTLEVPIERATPLTETFEHYAPISTYVFALGSADAGT